MKSYGLKNMPTSKQVRYHYGRCRKKFDSLLDALNSAHQANVIDYEVAKTPDGTWRQKHESVCDKVWEALRNFDKATERQLATAMRTEIQNKAGSK